MYQYTKSLNQVVSKNIDPIKLSNYSKLLEKALLYLKEVTTFDEYQIKKNAKTLEDLKKFINHIKNFENKKYNYVHWIDLINYTSKNLNFESKIGYSIEK